MNKNILGDFAIACVALLAVGDIYVLEYPSLVHEESAPFGPDGKKFTVTDINNGQHEVFLCGKAGNLVRIVDKTSLDEDREARTLGGNFNHFSRAKNCDEAFDEIYHTGLRIGSWSLRAERNAAIPWTLWTDNLKMNSDKVSCKKGPVSITAADKEDGNGGLIISEKSPKTGIILSFIKVHGTSGVLGAKFTDIAKGVCKPSGTQPSLEKGVYVEIALHQQGPSSLNYNPEPGAAAVSLSGAIHPDGTLDNPLDLTSYKKIVYDYRSASTEPTAQNIAKLTSKLRPDVGDKVRNVYQMVASYKPQ
jgi:hypothetical protein